MMSGVKRAVIIPIVVTPEGTILQLMGFYKTGEITDFGGGVKKGETPIDAGLRELHEETKNIFGDYLSGMKKRDLRRRSVTIENSIMSATFVVLGHDWRSEAPNSFRNEPVNENDEIHHVMWVREESFQLLIDQKPAKYQMWPKIIPFYRNLYTERVKCDLRRIAKYHVETTAG